MANYVIIPEVYIKEEPVDSEGERRLRDDDRARDPFQPEDEEDGSVHEEEDTPAGVPTDSPQHPRTPPLNLSKSDTSPLNFSSGHSSPPPLNLSRSSTPPLNLCKVKRENEEEEEGEVEEEEEDLLKSELSPEEEAADCESEIDAGSACIFEPEVNIESEDEDVQCNLDDSGDYNNEEEEEEEDDNDDDYLPRVRKRGTNHSRDAANVERKHQCPLCGKYFLTSSAMNGHVAKGHGTTLGIKFVCHVCGAPGSSRASLKRHLIRTHKLKNVDHPELLTKKCVHCGIGFASHILLYEHIRSDHGDKVQQYHNCNWCPALMRAKASLIRHIRRTHPGKEEPLLTIEKCSYCEESFSSKFVLQRHVKSSHPNLPPASVVKKAEENRKKKRYSVACEYCGRKFGSKPRLQYHIEVVHTNPPIKIYTCRMCGLTFPTAKQNNRHYRKVHRLERQKVHCGKCNITFKTPEECAQHRAIHPNTCEICQKQFLRRDSLREHLLIHSAPRHQCPHCTKKFTQRSNLKRHIRVHTGEKPYKCTFCSRCFSDKSACNSHIRVHTGYERSVCSVCGASFSKKQRLNYHMRMHTGEGLLYCPLCTRPNTNSYSLRKHIESHQQPLTKALTSIGFRALLVSDPNFVMRALQALTQATLQNISRHENIPNSFKEEMDEMTEMNGTTTDLSGITTTEETDVEECTKSLSNIGNFKTEPGSEVDDTALSEDYSCANDKGVEPRFNLTKFLQSLLEKESLKVRTDRRNRKDRRMRRSSLRSTSQETSSRLEEERESDEEELPTTVGDELVKQCLEIIMKDEPQTDDEYDENGMYSDDGMEYQMDCDQLGTEFVIKTEPPDEYDFESDQELDQKALDSLGSKQPSMKGIPKIKISRVTNSSSDSKDLFVAEIVKKK